MIFQEPMTSLNPVYTIGDQIGETVRLHQGLNRKDARERAIGMLRAVSIPAPRSGSTTIRTSFPAACGSAS